MADFASSKGFPPWACNIRAELAAVGENSSKDSEVPTSVTLYDQGLTQVLEAAVTGLDPKHPYVLALAEQVDGGGSSDL
jgi:hypothetical protein